MRIILPVEKETTLKLECGDILVDGEQAYMFVRITPSSEDVQRYAFASIEGDQWYNGNGTYEDMCKKTQERLASTSRALYKASEYLLKLVKRTV